LSLIDEFFSRYLGTDLSTMTPGEVRVAASSRRYEPELHYAHAFALWLLVFRDRCAVSVQPELLQVVSRLCGRLTPDSIRSAEARATLVSACATALAAPLQAGAGPVLYCKPDACWLWQDHPCRPLAPIEIPSLEAANLYGSHLESSVADGTCFVALDDDTPVSLCGTFAVPHLGDKIADMCVMGTLEPHRRRHFGRTVVAHSTDAVIRLGRVPVYQTTDHNTASIRTARSVGYTDYGWTFRVELSPGE
jgi:hypothetical protein